MKIIRILALVLGTALFAAAAHAEDVIKFSASMGEVTFPHKKHQDILKDCTRCHEKGPGKITGFGKEWAHQNCKGCHASAKAGPVSCKECHTGPKK